jgi:hypothetical protein
VLDNQEEIRRNLIEDLKAMRRSRLGVPLKDLPALRRIVLADDGTESESVRKKQILQTAAAALGEPRGNAVLLLLGVNSAASTEARRILAAELMDTTPNSLSRHQEKGLLEDFADQLLAIERSRKSPLGGELDRATENGANSADEDGEDLGLEELETALPTSDLAPQDEVEQKTDLRQLLQDEPAETSLAEGLEATAKAEPIHTDVSGNFQALQPWRKRRGLILAVGGMLVLGALVTSLATTDSWPFESTNPPTTGPITSGTAGSAVAQDSIDMRVGLPGSSFAHSASFAKIRAGDPVGWAIEVVHGGAGLLKDTSLIDQVPTGVVVIPGSVRLVNGNYPNGYVFPATAIQKNGTQINVEIGDYIPPGASRVAKRSNSAYLTFDTEFTSISPNNCTRRTITNRAWLGTTEYPGTVHASASAEVSC